MIDVGVVVVLVGEELLVGVGLLEEKVVEGNGSLDAFLITPNGQAVDYVLVLLDLAAEHLVVGVTTLLVVLFGVQDLEEVVDLFHTVVHVLPYVIKILLNSPSFLLLLLNYSFLLLLY